MTATPADPTADTAVSAGADAAPAAAAPAVSPAAGAGAARRARSRHAVVEPAAVRVRRAVSGSLLALVTLAAIAGAVLVVWFRVGFAPVLSPSMEPGFSAGDLLVTRALPASEIAAGDVVILPRPDAPGERYAHRVIEAETKAGDTGPTVRTRGDANPAADPQALRIDSPTVPLVVTSVPSLGRLALAGQHAWLRIALIVLIGSCVLLALKRLLLDRGADDPAAGDDTDTDAGSAGGAAAVTAAAPAWPTTDADLAAEPGAEPAGGADRDLSAVLTGDRTR